VTTNERIDLSRNAGDDPIVVNVKRRREKMTRIINIYDQRAREPRERPARRLSWEKIFKQGRAGTVLAGDFNAPCHRWDPRFTERRDAAYWEDIPEEHGLVIGNNDRRTHPWTRNE
jgi:hypothetical protein